MKSHESSKRGWLAKRLVCLLAATGLTAGAAMLGIVAVKLESVRSSRAELDSLQKEMAGSLASIERHCTRGEKSATFALSGGIDKTADGSWPDQLTNSINQAKLISIDEPIDRSLDDLAGLASQTEATLDCCQAWAHAFVRANADFSVSQIEYVSALQRLRAQASAMEGKQRLRLAVMIRDYRAAQGTRDEELAREVVDKEFRGVRISTLKRELAELAILSERLIHTSHSDDLIDLRDNQFKPSLERLQTVVRAESKAALLNDGLASLQTKLFGKGFEVDTAHQTIVPGVGGLYQAKENLLHLNEKRQQLRSQADQGFREFHEGLSRLQHEVAAQSDVRAVRAEQTMASAWTTMAVVALLCTVVFIGLSRVIGRAITDQIRDIDRQSQELAAQNQVVSVLQDVTVSANEALTREDAVRTALDCVCGFSGSAAGHAYFVDRNNAERLVPTNIWSVMEGTSVDRLQRATASSRLEAGEGIPGLVLSTGTSMSSDDQSEAATGRCSIARASGLEFYLAFPVTVGLRVVAVLELFARDAVQFDNRMWGLLNHIGDQLGRVFERDQSRRQLDEVHRELVATARQAGMAEVATGVLHNVGNVLNGIISSSTVVVQSLRDSKVKQLKRIIQIVSEHSDDLASYLANDPQGKNFLPYLSKVGDHLDRENERMQQELCTLNASVDHVKKVVAMQQDYTGTSDAKEVVSLAELIEDAVQLNDASFKRHRVELHREFADLPDVRADKHRIMLIAVNLIKNAKDSLCEAGINQPLVVVRIVRQGEDHVRIEVEDNGLGIPKDLQDKIFSFGFTTKPDGHGFGLHSCANAATEIGGRLSVESAGVGKGACFALELPLEFANADTNTSQVEEMQVVR